MFCRGVVFCFVVLPALCLAAAAAERGKIVGVEPYGIPDWFKESFLELEDDAQEAAESGRHLLLFFHLKDCPYCAKMLDDSFAGVNKALLQGAFDSVHIDIRGQREVTYRGQSMSEREFSRRVAGVQYTPALLFMDAAANAVLTVNGYRSPPALAQALRYVRDGAHKKMSLTEYNEARATAVYAPRPLPGFAALANLATVRGPLLALIEDQTCQECDWLHTRVLSRPDVQAQLQKLTATRIDGMSDSPLVAPNGRRGTARAFVRSLNLSYRPGVVFFEDGKEIFRITGLLNPYHFREAARYVAIGHRNAHPTFGAYLRVRREQLLAAGENVDYAIPK